MENLGNAVQKRKQVVDLTTLSDRLGSLEHLVRQHSDQLPPARPPRAKYATACVISDQGLHKPEKRTQRTKISQRDALLRSALWPRGAARGVKTAESGDALAARVVGCYENQRAFVPWRRSRLRVPAWLVLRLIDSLFSPMQSLASLGSTKQDVQKSA